MLINLWKKLEKCWKTKLRFPIDFNYCTGATITPSWFEAALNYKPRILDKRIGEFPCSVHNLSVTLTTLQYNPQWKKG